MRQRPENFKAAGEDPDTTLAAPRFDADDARRAHPVVPLAEATARAPYAHAARPTRAPRRAWTTALFAVVLLAVAALGGAVATQFMLSPRAERVQEAEQVQGQAQSAPVQAAEASPPQTSAPAAAEAPRRDAPAAGPAPRAARTRRARAVAAAPALEEAEDNEDEDGRGRASERRRVREDDEVEKAMRKALKRAKGKAPRLVDVLTSP